jgi:hypothetical protein
MPGALGLLVAQPDSLEPADLLAGQPDYNLALPDTEERSNHMSEAPLAPVAD